MGKRPRNALTFMPPVTNALPRSLTALCTIAVTLTLSFSACAPLSSKATHESLAITSRTLKNANELSMLIHPHQRRDACFNSAEKQHPHGCEHQLHGGHTSMGSRHQSDQRP